VLGLEVLRGGCGEMDITNQLRFNSYNGKQKPKTMLNPETRCPFCDRDNLEAILAQRGNILLVKNKYPVLQDTMQTVLIETDTCDTELSLYPKEHLYNVISFGIEHWLKMEESGKYASVLFYKNHGPFSGGTLAHPHMQINGLNHVDYRPHVKPSHFEGRIISEKQGVEFNISTKPRAGITEFNVILPHLDQLNTMADFIQIAAHYILNHYGHCTSYNLFFYHVEDKIMAKIIPRYVTSPLFIGYSIPQVSDRLEEIVKSIQNRYF
jgi:galactose-1-phosphate uridylyltransferase